MKVHMLILHTGYVEECSTGSLILWNPEGFDTVEDAINSLAAAFKEAWENNRQRALASAKRYHRCPHCDKPLVKDQPMQAEDIAELVGTYLTGIADGSHDIWEALEHHGWYTGLYVAPRDVLRDAVIIGEHAGAIIGIVAAGDPGEYLDIVEDWESNMKLPDGMILRNKPEEDEG